MKLNYKEIIYLKLLRRRGYKKDFSRLVTWMKDSNIAGVHLYLDGEDNRPTSIPHCEAWGVIQKAKEPQGGVARCG